MDKFKNLSFGVTLLLTFSTLQSCDLVTTVFAQGERELTFEAKKKIWDYAAEVMPPKLIEQVRQEIDESWIGDPKRFRVLKIQRFGQKSSLYFVNPSIPCPESGCQTQNLWNQYHPACGATGGCAYLAYIEEKGIYRKVFDTQFWRQAKADEVFLKVSRQLHQGYPACFELTGFDYESEKRGLPETRSDQVFVSRYCFNGKDYVFETLYVTQTQQTK